MDVNDSDTYDAAVSLCPKTDTYNLEQELRTMIFVCYPKCSTCQKAKKWLDEHHISYELRDIRRRTPAMRSWLRGISAAGCR